VAAAAEGSGMTAMAAALHKLVLAELNDMHAQSDLPEALLDACAAVAAAAAAAQACTAAGLARLTAFTRAEEQALQGADDAAQATAAAGVSSAFRLTTRALSLLRTAVPQDFALPHEKGGDSAAAALWNTHALQLGGAVEALHKMLAFWEARPLVAVGLWAPEEYLAWCASDSPASSAGRHGARSHSDVPDTCDQGALMAALATPAPPTTVRER